VSIDQVDPKVIRAKRAFIRSRHAIAAAGDDLESHQLWLDRHCAAWAEDVKLCERKLSCKLRTRAIKRLALGLFLIGPITCLALLRLIVRLLPSVRGLFFSSLAWFHALIRLARKHAGSHLSPWSVVRATKNYNKARHRYRIAGLDGPLCTGQPASSNVAPKSETGLLRVRLIVASFGAVIVGLLASATTPDRQDEPAEASPNTLVLAGQSAPLPPVASNKLSAPSTSSGFAVLAAPREAERISPIGTTIAEIISITRPSPNAREQPEATAEALEVTPPVRKPKIKIKAKPKRSPTKQNHQLTLWERLPWLR
jgi:hypothetical protein